MEPMLKAREVAELLGVTAETVRSYARRGKLPAVRLGGKKGPLRWRRETVERFCGKSRTHEPSAASIREADRAALIAIGLWKPEGETRRQRGRRATG